MVGMSVFEIVSKKGEKCPFGLNLPSLAKKGTNLIQFMTFFHPLGAMFDKFCCGLFVQKSALMSLAQS